MKQCTACAKEGVGPLPLSAFKPSKRYRGGFTSWCRAHVNASVKRWQAENPIKRRLSELRAGFKRRYGLTLERYQEMYAAQSGCCAICRRAVRSQVDVASRLDGRVEKAETAHVDHCHNTGRVRGLLCTECNTGIGYLKESPDVLRAAIAYLSEGG